MSSEPKPADEPKPVSVANKNMLKHQKWKAANPRPKETGPRASGTGTGALVSALKWILLAVGTSLLLSRSVTETWTFGYEGKYLRLKTVRAPLRASTVLILGQYLPKPTGRVFTPADLALHDGLHPPYGTFLAVDGDVYDVSSSATYAPGGSYHHFAGKDAGRAYVTGCFKTDLTHDLRGLTDAELTVRVHSASSRVEADDFAVARLLEEVLR